MPKKKAAHKRPKPRVIKYPKKHFIANGELPSLPRKKKSAEDAPWEEFQADQVIRMNVTINERSLVQLIGLTFWRRMLETQTDMPYRTIQEHLRNGADLVVHFRQGERGSRDQVTRVYPLE